MMATANTVQTTLPFLDGIQTEGQLPLVFDDPDGGQDNIETEEGETVFEVDVSERDTDSGFEGGLK